MATYRELPSNKDLAAKVVDGDTEIELKRVELGAIGCFLGDARNKPGSVAAVTIALSFVMIGVSMFALSSDHPVQQTAITLFGGLISGSIGYLFGRSNEASPRRD